MAKKTYEIVARPHLLERLKPESVVDSTRAIGSRNDNRSPSTGTFAPSSTASRPKKGDALGRRSSLTVS
jgi:hypothetical protein